MPEIVSALQAIGVDIGGRQVRAARLTLQKDGPVVEAVYRVVAADSDEDVNPLYISDEGKELSALLDKELSVTALHTKQCLVRQLDLKLKKERDIEAVLAFQAEPLLPYPVDEAFLDWIPLEKSDDGTRIAIIAARKEHVAEHLEKWRRMGVEPEVVSAVPAALAVFAGRYSPIDGTQFVINIGAEFTTCVLVNGGKLLAAQSAHFGTSHIDEERKVIEQWRSELTRILFSLEKQAKGAEAASVLVTGEGAAIDGLAKELLEGVGKDAVPPIEGVLPVEQMQEYAIAIGLALMALPKTPWQINFRQQELAYPNPWRRLIKPVSLYFLACVLLAWAVSTFGSAYYGYQQDQVKEEYADLLAVMDKPYDAFEEEFSAKFGTDGQMTLKSLTNEELTARLAYLEKEIKAAPDTIALLPDVPTTSDVLAWLSTHPNVVKNGEPLLKIDNFHYVMVQRPEEKKRQNRYQVKVELEFSSPNPSLAREFHDALIAPNDIVDPKGEIKWSSQRGKYRTSFFLKDKTKYPSGRKPS
ncbi:MAG: pilus assembly protein PilM [Chlamydiales bacterium]|nr:pilus assembly protein PilM [Chlamydiia bacterium]MCP5507487.1 pilus assembly protein PilM [Chlamydiales bacterium]